ncbi:DUF2726 domain-containing protein [Rubrivivax sp. RP6-9]|uniref:DUF2726 domain-containing protein n=1 Tax=Rubrivivax sp. RP6-9 TaxID=3415750 RepID=UPI003CC5ACF4
MNLLDPTSSPALAAAVVLLLTLLAVRMRQRQGQRRQPTRDNLDTVQGWMPESARIMSIHERQAYDLLRRALPGFLVLAQVPLSRFLRVPTRHSYNEWLQRVGSLNADLLLCDAGSRVLAVIDIRAPEESSRSRRRHERLARVLKAAGIRVYTWREGDLPSLAEVRSTMAAELAPAQAEPKTTNSRPMPLIPVADIEEVLAEGDQFSYDTALEPVPSGFYEEEGDSVRGQLARG